MAKKEMNENCHMHGTCPKCMGIKMLILGVLVLLNTYYNTYINWAYFIGLIIAIKGIIMLVKPHCPHCK